MPSDQWLDRQAGRIRELQGYATGNAAHRRAQRREWFFRLASHFTPVIATESELGRIFVSTEDRKIGMQTFMHGGYDRGIIENVLADLDKHRPTWQNAGVIVEVGANIGTTSLMLASRGSVLAFEPVPANVALLRQNVLANDLQDRITVRPVALSDAPGNVTMDSTR